MFNFFLPDPSIKPGGGSGGSGGSGSSGNHIDCCSVVFDSYESIFKVIKI